MSATNPANPPDPHRQYRLLIVDDEPEITYLFGEYFSELGYQTETAESAAEAMRIWDRVPIDLVLLDINMPRVSGVSLLEQMKHQRPEVIVFMISAIHDVEMVVRCIQLGAHDYLVKPIIDLNQVRLRVEHALEERATREENLSLRARLDQVRFDRQIIARSPGMQKVVEKINTVAQYDTTVLITGASGTGKDLVAQTIHEQSKRAQKPFIAVNCGSLPAGLLESTLFGHTKGAFTGATQQTKGLFEESNHGTIFLDEITETSPDFQVQLLHVLENGTIRRVGSAQEMKLDLRVLTATNRTLETEVKHGRFREDLYYRLNVFNIHLPGLKERIEDLPLLAAAHLNRLAVKMNREPVRLSDEVLGIFRRYDWPGNVRELVNVLENTLIRCTETVITPVHLPEALQEPLPDGILPPAPAPYQESLADYEKTYFTALLARTGGNVSKAAVLAGLSRQHLHLKLKKLGLKP